MNYFHRLKPQRSAPRKQRGIALITVLLLLVFILASVGALFYRHQVHLQKVSQMLIGEQALLLLISAEEWAASLLVEDSENSDTDHFGEKWAQGLPLLPVEGGSISGCIRDLQGAFNINNLAWYTNKSWEDEIAAAYDTSRRQATTQRTIYRDLLQQLGLDADDKRIAALIDWVDADGWLTTADSAEDNEYLLVDPPYRAANQPIGELTELALVAGYSMADVTLLRAYLAALPEQEVGLNVNTAPAPLLAALSTDLDHARAVRLMAQRPFADLNDFYRALANIAADTRQNLQQQIPAQLLTVNSHYFNLQAEILLAGFRFSYSAIIHRRNGEASILARTMQPLPRVAADDGDQMPAVTLCHHLNEPELI